jgi:hypothetical protein
MTLDIDSLYYEGQPHTSIRPRCLKHWEIKGGFVALNQIGNDTFMVHFSDPEEKRFYFSEWDNALLWYCEKVTELAQKYVEGVGDVH